MKLIPYVLVFASLTACGSIKYNVPSSAKAPGADAKLVARVHEESASTQIQLTAENLAPPERVGGGAKAYVAWYRKDSHAKWQRISGLKYDEGSRKAKLEASAPETSFDFEVSAEADPAVESPSSDIVFHQRVN